MFETNRCPYCKKPLSGSEDWCKYCACKIFKDSPVRHRAESSLAKSCFKIGAAALVVAGVTGAILQFLR